MTSSVLGIAIPNFLWRCLMYCQCVVGTSTAMRTRVHRPRELGEANRLATLTRAVIASAAPRHDPQMRATCATAAEQYSSPAAPRACRRQAAAQYPAHVRNFFISTGILCDVISGAEIIAVVLSCDDGPRLLGR